jgi:hypothetical protein
MVLSETASGHSGRFWSQDIKFQVGVYSLGYLCNVVTKAGHGAHICNPRIWKQEDCELETSLGYIESFRLAWVTERDPASKNQRLEI